MIITETVIEITKTNKLSYRYCNLNRLNISACAILPTGDGSADVAATGVWICSCLSAATLQGHPAFLRSAFPSFQPVRCNQQGGL